ncbi:MAG: thioredoxin-dependent thiol peroxidase [Acidimicrobiia bacterium]|nr:MAG: thioredoxin-dependent thiol peroxidase [Acidimicrobiia bacterium]
MKLESGNPAPAFARRDQSGAVVTNADLSGKKAIIYFYPKAFTPGCTTQSCDFRDNYQAFQKAGYEILGVSPDPVEKLESFREEYDLPFPLLSDEDHSMAEAFGAWGTQTNYGKEYVGLIRSTFALDEEGAVSHAWYNVKAKGNVARVGSEVLE